MDSQAILLIAVAVLVMATLYSTVGHGGGSGYLAVLAIATIAPEQMHPTALLLNVVVATIATWMKETIAAVLRAARLMTTRMGK